jgi:hypothetical protein
MKHILLLLFVAVLFGCDSNSNDDSPSGTFTSGVLRQTGVVTDNVSFFGTPGDTHAMEWEVQLAVDANSVGNLVGNGTCRVSTSSALLEAVLQGHGVSDPSSFTFTGTVVGSSVEMITEGDCRMAARSGGTLTGRFENGRYTLNTHLPDLQSFGGEARDAQNNPVDMYRNLQGDDFGTVVFRRK